MPNDSSDQFIVDPTADAAGPADVFDATLDPATDADANVTDLQDQAQQAVIDGDYATAADYQAQAETAAAAAGDTGDLTGPDSGDLQTAATDQQTAATDQAQEETYAAATDAATNAAAAATGADQSGGGLTNDGSADTEALDESWANWDQETA